MIKNIKLFYLIHLKRWYSSKINECSFYLEKLQTLSFLELISKDIYEEITRCTYLKEKYISKKEIVCEKIHKLKQS